MTKSFSLRNAAALAITIGLVSTVACKDDADSAGDSATSGDATDAGPDTSASTSVSSTTASTTSTTSPSTTASTTASTTESGETTDSGPGIEGFDDEFDDPGTLANWTRLHETEGDEAPYASLDVGDTMSGHLTVVPVAGGWFGDFDGPFLYKDVGGDFVVEVWVSATGAGGDSAPDNLYNSAGLMVRDPASGNGSENWVIHNVGRQSLEVGVASEGKTTRNSSSSLVLTPGTYSGMLRICRIGSTFILARQLDDENAFRETNRYERPELPGTLQVGMMSNGWNSNGGTPDLGLVPDVIGTFDYIRLWRPDGDGACLAP